MSTSKNYIFLYKLTKAITIILAHSNIISNSLVIIPAKLILIHSSPLLSDGSTNKNSVESVVYQSCVYRNFSFYIHSMHGSERMNTTPQKTLENNVMVIMKSKL